jgi:hypothetical protein
MIEMVQSNLPASFMRRRTPAIVIA